MADRNIRGGSASLSNKSLNLPAIGVALALVVLWLVYLGIALSTTTSAWVPDFLAAFLHLPPPADNDISSTVLTRRGQLGDSFGVFNALVSSLALWGLIVTLMLQQRQLKSQQRQSESQQRLSEASNLLLAQQQFQEHFYRAVDAYRSLLSDVATSGSSPGGETTYKGRQALYCLWKELIGAMESQGSAEFVLAVSRQMESNSAQYGRNASSRRDAAASIQKLELAVRADEQEMNEALSTIGPAWLILYQTNEFQLDALFRAWYTVYRVLDTAPRYAIGHDEIKLYSAMFRAQLSWIEMAFLLANQSALPAAPAFPLACVYSNKYAVFDNLATDNDLVVSVLKAKAMAAIPNTDSRCAILSWEAFKSRVASDIDDSSPVAARAK